MRFAAISLLTAVITACGGAPRASDQIELQRVQSGNLEVVLLSNDGSITHGKDVFSIEFRRGDSLVDVGTVKVAATMPMAGLPPMQGSVFLEPGDAPGRYMAETDLSMSGGWQIKLEWNGPAGQGTASFNTTIE